MMSVLARFRTFRSSLLSHIGGQTNCNSLRSQLGTPRSPRALLLLQLEGHVVHTQGRGYTHFRVSYLSVLLTRFTPRTRLPHPPHPLLFFWFPLKNKLGGVCDDSGPLSVRDVPDTYTATSDLHSRYLWGILSLPQLFHTHFFLSSRRLFLS